MTCETMREQLLEAELEELDGIGSSPVAAHVRECARCRAIAEQLLADTRLLGAEVERLSAHASARIERLSSRVEPVSSRIECGSQAERASCRAGIASRRRVWRGRYLAVGTLAAAALAFVVATRIGHRDVAPVVPVITHPVRNTEPSRVASASVPSTSAGANKGGANAAESAPVAATMPVAATIPAATSPASRRPLEHAVQPHPLPAAQPVSPTRLAPRSVTRPLVMADAQPLVSVTPPPGKRAAIMRTPDPAITVVWLY